MEMFYAKDRREWRAWLRKHGSSCQEIWLVYYKKGSGKPRVPYDHAVEEALCYGWIDGMVRRLDEQRYLQRFTPRCPGSEWAPSNLKRMKRLIAAGRVTRAGLKVYNVARKTTPPLPTQMPRELEKIFKAQAEAWRNYQGFPPYYRRLTTGWVASAKKEETRRKRLEKLIDLSARNERIKLM